jgi:hypothetical protein
MQSPIPHATSPATESRSRRVRRLAMVHVGTYTIEQTEALINRCLDADVPIVGASMGEFLERALLYKIRKFEDELLITPPSPKRPRWAPPPIVRDESYDAIFREPGEGRPDTSASKHSVDLGRGARHSWVHHR